MIMNFINDETNDLVVRNSYNDTLARILSVGDNFEYDGKLYTISNKTVRAYTPTGEICSRLDCVIDYMLVPAGRPIKC